MIQTKRRLTILLITVGVFIAAFAATLSEPQAAERLEVSSFHPRIFVRHDQARLGRGLTVGELRRRLSDPAYRRWRRLGTGKDPVGEARLAEIVERAARYLEEGNQGDLEAVRQYLQSHTFSYAAHDVAGFLAGAEMATALDWVYDGLSETDRAASMANIVTTADASYNFLLKGQPDINHNYTYMALHTVAICGLVLKGERAPYGARAEEYLTQARQWLEGAGKVFDTWQAREGAWGEGNHYTFHETLRTLVMTLQAYRTATATDYFALIECQHGSFAAQAGRFLIASTRPDLTFERIGDVAPSRAMAAMTVPLTVEALAAGLSDADEAARLRSFADALREAYGERALHPAFDWGMRIFHAAHAPRTPSYKTLPLAMRLGAGTYDLITFRSGWETDSTLITLLAGDHYTDHQHLDKGHFLIYRRGGLAVDSGTYDAMYKPGGHWNNYASRTLAHNCVLVYDPAQTFPKGYSNDGGQSVLRGLQHHADWPTYLDHYQREKLDTAEVLAWEADKKSGYGYVRCDLAGAYSGKVMAYQRQFVYLPADDFLVVFDRISAARPDYAKRLLLHFQERPMIDGVAPRPGVNRFPNAKLTSVRRRGQFHPGGRSVTYDGALSVHTLLPAKRNVAVIGGAGFQYFDSFAGVNYPPSRSVLADELREAGAWRIEVAPTRPAKDDLFLHAFQIADGATKQPVRTRLLATEQMVGAQFLAPQGCQIVLFAKDQKAGPVALPITYTVSSPVAARHLLVEMPPSQRVVIEIGGRASGTQTVSAQGVLSFYDRARGQRRIVIRPVSSTSHAR